MSLHDPLEGGWIDPGKLKACIATVTRFTPSTLVLSEDAFRRLVNATFIHPYGGWLRNEYVKLGIKRVIWMEDLPEGEFLLSSDKIPNDIETLDLKVD